MLIKKPQPIRPSEITAESVYRDRRRLLLGAGLALAGAGLSGDGLAAGFLSGLFGGDEKDKAKEAMPDGLGKYYGSPKNAHSTSEEPSEYEDVTSYNNFYELGIGKSDPAANAELLVTDPWSVRVEGECEKPGNYALEDFLKGITLEERIYRHRCVEAWSAVIPWIGFSLAEVLKRYQPTSKAKYVEFVTLYDPERLPMQRRQGILDWPYVEGLRIDEAMNPLATLAVGMYNDPLPNQNGAPLRLVLPWKYGFKSIKSIVAIRFLEKQPINTWNALQPNEYGFYANVNPAVDHPRWSQARERRLGEWSKRDTLPFNGYAEQVAGLYRGMDLAKFF